MLRLAASLIILTTACWGLSRHAPRILGGEEADIQDFPFAASIQFQDSGHYCGAVVVGDEWVLTDAYCTQNPAEIADFTIQVGSTIDSNGSIHSVTEWIFHPLADVFYNEYDFALVKVDPPFEFTEFAAAATLPDLNQETPDGAVGAVAGWGQTDNNTAPSTMELQYANITLFSEANCATLLGFDYNESTLCGQNMEGGVALCWRDEGGPLVVNGTLLGIALWPRVLCDDPMYVQKFGRVASVRDWIDTTIGA